MRPEANEDLTERLSTYYAWKLVIGQIERVFLPEARETEREFERRYADEASAGGFAPNLIVALARSRRARLDDGLRELRDRFIALFGRARLPSA
jgi:hypothetical protein